MAEINALFTVDKITTEQFCYLQSYVLYLQNASSLSS